LLSTLSIVSVVSSKKNGSNGKSGAALLNEYLSDKGEAPYAFAKRAGIDYAQLLRILRGTKGSGNRMTVNLAARIREATNGVVPTDSWVTMVN